MKRSINWLPVVCFAAIGLVYFYASIQMTESFSGGYGHRTVPLAMSILILLLCVPISYELWKTHNQAQQQDDQHVIWLNAFVSKVLPLVAILVAYGLFQIWFGYILSTVLCGVAVFRLFGNRWTICALNGVIGTAIIYFLFFHLLNLYDPPGSIIDLSRLF